MSGMVYKNFGFSIPFLRGYRELRIPIMDSAGNPAWPELFPTSRIDALRDMVGMRHFSAQMMLEYVAPDRAKLDPDALHLYSAEYDTHSAKLADAVITGYSVYWDPSSGRRGADGSVCVLVYRDDVNHHIYIHDVLYLTVPDGTLHQLGYQCEKVLDFLTRHNVWRINVETNGIGNALPEILCDTASRRGARIYVTPIVNTRPKETRILDSIEPVLGTGRLHAHTRVQQTPLISEMIGWSPLGGVGHDDGLDAVAGAICCAATVLRPLGHRTTVFNANTDFKL